MPRFVAPGILIWLVTTSAAFAQVSLPLGGYYRPGKCIPVLIEDGKQGLRISADGAVPTVIHAGVGRRVVPFLILSSSAHSVRIGEREIPIRALGADEKLVASSSQIPVEVASLLFPGQTVIPVIESAITDPAWEALDGIILDESIGQAQLCKALASGALVAVRSSNRPDNIWPWKQMGAFWFLKADIAGPMSAIGGETSYLPLQSWQVEQPESFRRMVVLVGVLVTLLMLATLLIRSRRTSMVVLVLVALLCVGSLAAWRRARQAYQDRIGVVEVLRGGVQQDDIWWYLAAGASGTEGHSEIEDRPILLNADHASFLHLALEIQADGSLRWSYQLPPYARLALLNRTVWTAVAPQALSSNSESSLRDMVKQSYLTKGTQILGEHEPVQKFRPLHWPTVVVGEE